MEAKLSIGKLLLGIAALMMWYLPSYSTRHVAPLSDLDHSCWSNDQCCGAA